MKRWSEMSSIERDFLIAERVMGYPRDTAINLTSDNCHSPLRYSTDIAAAWEVANEVMGNYFELSFLDGKWSVYFSSGDAQADTAPEAICLAALKSLGIDV